MAQPLYLPQLPPPKPTPAPKDWKGIHGSLGANDTYLRSLVLYLQTYLTKVYYAIVPAEDTVASIANGQSPYTPSATDEFLAVSASATTPTNIALPVTTGSGRRFIVQKVDANAQNVVIMADGADLINGAATLTITAQYGTVTLVDYAAGFWAAY